MNRPLRLLFVALAAGVFAFAIHVDFPLCPLAGSFGIPCPGCGLTRATLALLHGDLRSALHFHPLVWLLAPLFVAFMGGALLELIRGGSTSDAPRARLRWSSRGVTVVASVLLFVTLAVWLARFAGAFGGPVAVTSLHDWLSQRH